MAQNSARLFNYATLKSTIDLQARGKRLRPITRRDFMKYLAAGAATAIVLPTLRTSARSAGNTASHRAQTAAATAASNTATTLPNGIASGDTTQTSTMLWAHSTVLGDVTFEYGTDEMFTGAVRLTATVTDVTIPVKVSVDGLTADTPYFYRVSNGTDTLTGKFRTPAASGAKRGLHFGVTGDWRGELRPYVAISNVVEKELDFFIAHGDTIYGDIPSRDFPGEQAITLADFRIKHNEVYTNYLGVNTLADVRANTTQIVMIDDHEVTDNFSGGAAPSADPRFASYEGQYINQTELYRNGLQVFSEFNPLSDQTYNGTGDDRVDGVPKLYRYLTYGDDAAVIMLDARSFRDLEVPNFSTASVFSASARTAYYQAMFAEGRTMLGRPQVEDLKRDLLAAHQAGITWKFVLIPEPMQLMGWFGGNDRWEGYAPERTEVLQYIEDNNILNVVFVSADIHSTFINKLTYQTQAMGTLTNVRSFEITTGAVAFDPPTGAALVDGVAQFGLLTADQYAAYQQASIADQDLVLLNLFNQFVNTLQGYDAMGFEGSGLNARLMQGTYVAGHTYGWSEFQIDAATQQLTITTYGVRAYSQAAIDSTPDEILALTPEIINQIVVDPLTA